MPATWSFIKAAVQHVLLGLCCDALTGSMAASLQGTGCNLRVWHAEEASPIAQLGEACGAAPLKALVFEAGERLANPSWLPCYGIRLAACSAAEVRSI